MSLKNTFGPRHKFQDDRFAGWVHITIRIASFSTKVLHFLAQSLVKILRIPFFSGGGEPTKNRKSQDDRKIQNQSFVQANRGPKGQPEYTTTKHPAPHLGDKLQTRGPDNNSRAKEDACCQQRLSPSYSETRDS